MFDVPSSIKVDWKTLKVTLRAMPLALPESNESWEKDPKVYLTILGRTQTTVGSRGDVMDQNEADLTLPNFAARLFAPNKKFLIKARVKAKNAEDEKVEMHGSVGPFVATCGSSQTKKVNQSVEIKQESLEEEMEDYDRAPSYKIESNLKVTGSVRAERYEQYSDERLKQHIEELSNACQTLQSLRGTSYRWRKDAPPNTSGNSSDKIIGFIAQEVAEALPEAVERTSEGYLAVSYASIVPVFVSAIKEHALDLQSLKSSSEEAQKTLENLRSELAMLATLDASSVARSAVNRVKKELNHFLVDLSKPLIPMWKAILISGTIVTLLAFIAAMVLLSGVAYSGGVLCQPSNPVSFSPKNYLSNGDFEDTSNFPNATGWSGTYILEFYNRSSSLGASDLKSSAPFDFGNLFMLLQGSSYAKQEISQQTLADLVSSPFYALDASLWVYVISAGNVTDVSLAVEYFDFDIALPGEVPYCSSVVNPGVVTPGWQLLKTSLSCNSQLPPLRVSISIVSTGTSIACDMASVVRTPLTVVVEPQPESYEDIAPLQEAYDWSNTPVQTWVDMNSADIKCIPDCDFIPYSFQGRLVLYALRYLKGSTYIPGQFYVWNSTNWVETIPDTQYGMNSIVCGPRSCYSTTVGRLRRFDPLRQNASAATVYEIMPDPPTSIIGWGASYEQFLDPWERYIWFLGGDTGSRVLRLDLNTLEYEPLESADFQMPGFGGGGRGFVATLNLDVYITSTYVYRIFRWSNALQSWSEITFNLINVGYLDPIFTDGRRVYTRCNRGVFEFRGDSWVLVLDSPVGNQFHARLDGRFLYDSGRRFYLPGPSEQLFTGMPGSDYLHRSASPNGGRVLLATFRNVSQQYGSNPIKFYVFPDTPSLRNITQNSTRPTSFNFVMDSASYLGSDDTDSAVGLQMGTDEQGNEQLVLGANIPSSSVTLGMGSHISLLGAATTSSVGCILFKTLNQPQSSLNLVRIGPPIVELAVSRGSGSQIFVSLSNKTVAVLNRDATAVIWSYTFGSTLTPSSIAIDEQGAAAVLCANSARATNFTIFRFSADGERIATVSYESIATGIIRMTSDYGGVLWASGQQDLGPLPPNPFLNVYSSSNLTILQSLWNYSLSDMQSRLFNNSGSVIRQLHYGPDKKLYVLADGFWATTSVLRTDGVDPNTNILVVNETDSGGFAFLGRIDPDTSRVTLGRFNIPPEFFGIDYRALRRRPSIASNSNGEVWIAGTHFDCLSGFEAKRINCTKLSNCTGDAYILKISRRFGRQVISTPVSLRGTTGARAFLAVGANRTAALFEIAANSSVAAFYTKNSSTEGSPVRIGNGNSTDLWLGIWQEQQPSSRCDRQITTERPKFINLDAQKLSFGPLGNTGPSLSVQVPNAPPSTGSLPLGAQAPFESASVFAPDVACSGRQVASVGGIIACAVVGVLIMSIALVALFHPSVEKSCSKCARNRR